MKWNVAVTLDDFPLLFLLVEEAENSKMANCGNVAF